MVAWGVGLLYQSVNELPDTYNSGVGRNPGVAGLVNSYDLVFYIPLSGPPPWGWDAGGR